MTRIVEATPTSGATLPESAPESTLAKVLARGKLVCGINDQLPGFSFGDAASGNVSRFDADFCRAVAAAIFGDKDAVEFKPYAAEVHFAALQNGDIDVRIRNTTRTLSCNADEQVNFAAVTFYDGQGIMVRRDSGIAGLEDLDGDAVCVQRGTTTESNLAELAASGVPKFSIQRYDDADETFAAYNDGACVAVTADKSALRTWRNALPDPQNHLILDMTLSKEPLASAVRQDDPQWLNLLNWVVFATIAAEEYNLNAQNVDAAAETDQRAEVRRLLGSDPQVDLGAKLGLPRNWAVNVIKAMGNYAEIYDRHFGPTSINQIPRGLNSLYRNGGLLHTPPFR